MALINDCMTRKTYVKQVDIFKILLHVHKSNIHAYSHLYRPIQRITTSKLSLLRFIVNFKILMSFTEFK